MDLLKKVIRLGIIISIIPGCALTKIEKSTVKIDNQKPLVFKFQSNTEPTKPVSRMEIADAIAHEIKNSSGYKPKYLERKVTNNEYAYVKGLSISLNEEFINLIYNNGMQYEKIINPRITYQTASYGIKFEDKDGITKATVTPPSSYVLTPSRNLLMIPIAPYLAPEEINKDIAKINAQISPELKRTRKTTGEFTVKYNNDAVSANYSRLLKAYGNTYKTTHIFNFDLPKGNVYKVNKGDRDIPVKIATYPYRNGTKVLYEFNITYELKSDGSSTYSKTDENKIIRQIKKIAND